jgi:hypothetical protein
MLGELPSNACSKEAEYYPAMSYTVYLSWYKFRECQFSTLSTPVDKHTEKSTSQIRLQALYYWLVRRGFAERFYQAEMVGRICEIARPFLFC